LGSAGGRDRVSSAARPHAPDRRNVNGLPLSFSHEIPASVGVSVLGISSLTSVEMRGSQGQRLVRRALSGERSAVSEPEPLGPPTTPPRSVWQPARSRREVGKHGRYSSCTDHVPPSRASVPACYAAKRVSTSSSRPSITMVGGVRPDPSGRATHSGSACKPKGVGAG